jgi:hypothetical protein
VKNKDELTTFLRDEVDLNQHRIDTLTDRVAAISEYLRASKWPVVIHRFSPQGSWAHKTIIKPPSEQGFDADLIVFVAPVAGWSAADYLLTLRQVIRESGVYDDKAGLRTRCVTLTYAGDFEIDLVPCVVGRPGARFEVCNRSDNIFEPTDSEAYTRWFEERNSWVGEDRLREVTRLLKYLRDIKGTFSCKSILLTTLLGQQVTAADSILRSIWFPDTPTALRTLIGRLDDYLQAKPQLHEISNPVLPSEHFVRHWDEDKYATFREMIHRYRGWVDDAYLEPDSDKSLSKWQRIFGDEFRGRSLGAVVAIAGSAVVPAAIGLPYADAVAAIRQYGSQLLSGVRAIVPWMKAPPWRIVPKLVPIISASMHSDRSGSALIGTVQSGQVLPKNVQLRFEARSSSGIAFSAAKDYEVQWQVVNTDRAALEDRQLRGGFERSHSPGVRWESTKYHGIHWIQAFVIRRRDRACVGTSQPFFVVIE